MSSPQRSTSPSHAPPQASPSLDVEKVQVAGAVSVARPSPALPPPPRPAPVNIFIDNLYDPDPEYRQTPLVSPIPSPFIPPPPPRRDDHQRPPPTSSAGRHDSPFGPQAYGRHSSGDRGGHRQHANYR